MPKGNPFAGAVLRGANREHGNYRTPREFFFRQSLCKASFFAVRESLTVAKRIRSFVLPTRAAGAQFFPDERLAVFYSSFARFCFQFCFRCGAAEAPESKLAEAPRRKFDFCNLTEEQKRKRRLRSVCVFTSVAAEIFFF
ncbi:MAG: hypothetical protein II561_05410 [Thermoguttaceae bacterium]|nr:hypothetical protein [Thermoguttaceae bacterium]